MTAEPDHPLLRFERVSKRFANGVTALEGLDVAVTEHSFLALLGPSGSGKSTALRLLAGLTEPSTGRLVWREAQPRIGVVFQEATLMPWARVDDNVALPLRLAGEPQASARAQARTMLDAVGLADFTGAYPRELSGGMKMRAALARALITEPHLLLLDEPFAALDEIVRARLNRDLLALWRARPLTVVFITHSVFEAVFLAQRIIVLSARPGRVAADITVDGPYPRGDDWRLSPAFAATARQVSQALEEAVRGTPDVA